MAYENLDDLARSITASYKAIKASALANALAIQELAKEVELLKGSGTGTRPPVTPPIPVNSVAPAITGTATLGQTLTVSTGTWADPQTYAYQWRRCDTGGNSCFNIVAATSNTYVLTSSDVGSTIRCIVSATNTSGTGTATSAQTATIAGAASSFGASLPARLAASTGSVINVTTKAQLETQLATCAFGSIIDGGGFTYDYTGAYYAQWNRNPGSPFNVTTIRNCKINNGYFAVRGGSYVRFEDCESINSNNAGAGYGFRAELASHHWECVRYTATNSNHSGFLINGNAATDYWQIWDSTATSCGGTSGLSHSLYAEAHTANCVIANFLSVDHAGFGIHVSTDSAGSYPTTGLIVTGCTVVNGLLKSSLVVYSTPGDTQTNTKFVGIISQDSPTGIVECWEPLANNNRLVGAVEYSPAGSNYQLANMVPIYNGGTGLVSTNPLLNATTYRPSSTSSAKDIVHADYYGYLPALDKDGNARITADAGCYRVPA